MRGTMTRRTTRRYSASEPAANPASRFAMTNWAAAVEIGVLGFRSPSVGLAMSTSASSKAVAAFAPVLPARNRST